MIYRILIASLLNILMPFICFATETAQEKAQGYKERCLEDLEFFRKNIIENSAPIKDPKDKYFKEWFDKGYTHTKELIEDIEDSDDCYYAMKYYINGFNNAHVSLRAYIQSPPEKYPGLLTTKVGEHHVVIYKDPSVAYLSNIKLGSQLISINDIKIDDYFDKYIAPFYANDNSEYSRKVASVFVMIVNGNRYVPIQRTASFLVDEKEEKVDLKYTDLPEEAMAVAKSITQPDARHRFKVEMIGNGVWIRIPTFYLSKEESVFYTGMLSRLKELAKEDYIIFDLRGNRGGATKWARPIIRNLWGDDYLKSLGQNHDYNNGWIKKVRVSKRNFFKFKKTANASEIKKFATALKNNDDFFEKKWKIYDEDINLYSNKDSSPFRAKIFVLTDHFCRSTCWSFVNEIMEIPKVVHIGLPTSIQTTSSFADQLRSPDEQFDFFYPTEIRIYPNRNLGTELVPSEIFQGNIRNEQEVIDWVTFLAEKYTQM